MAFLHHVWRYLHLTTRIGLKLCSVIQDHVRVECDCPVSLEYEVDLSDVAFFLIDVTVIYSRLVHTRHKAKSQLVNKIAFTLLVVLKKGAESFSFNHIFEEEACNDTFLNCEGNCVEVGPLLK